MNSNRFATVVALVSLSLLAGCSYFTSEDTVPRSELTKITGERDLLKKKVEELEARKPVEIVSGMTASQCTAMGEQIVAKSVKEMCVGKPVVKYLPAKPGAATAVATARASAHARADAQVAVATPQVSQRAPGGCIHTSDGTLLLKGQSTPQPKGKEVGRIADGDLTASTDTEIKKLLGPVSDKEEKPPEVKKAGEEKPPS